MLRGKQRCRIGPVIYILTQSKHGTAASALSNQCDRVHFNDQNSFAFVLVCFRVKYGCFTEDKRTSLSPHRILIQQKPQLSVRILGRRYLDYHRLYPGEQLFNLVTKNPFSFSSEPLRIPNSSAESWRRESSDSMKLLMLSIRSNSQHSTRRIMVAETVGDALIRKPKIVA